MYKDIPIDAITIGPRFRKDLGDIADLAASIEAVGLLHPIVVTTTHALIVGRRRLAAYVHLERSTIPALVVDLDNVLTAEFDENERRLDLAASERVAIIEALHEHLAAKATERQREAGKTYGRGKKLSDKVRETIEIAPEEKIAFGKLPKAIPAPVNARETAAKAVGWSGNTYAKARKIVKAAEEDDELQSFVEQMDRTGKVDSVYKQLPAYVREPEDGSETPLRPPRPCKYETILKRVDTVFQNTMVPNLRHLSDEDRENLRILIRFYLTMIDKEEDAAHGNSSC